MVGTYRLTLKLHSEILETIVLQMACICSKLAYYTGELAQVEDAETVKDLILCPTYTPITNSNSSIYSF